MYYQCILLTDLYPSRLWARPIGAYRVATELREAGYSTLVINGISDFSTEELKKILLRHINNETIFIGVSNTFLRGKSKYVNRAGSRGKNAPEDLCLDDIFFEIKSSFSDLKIILGGTNLYDDFLKSTDVRIFGYADHVIVKIAEDMKKNKNNWKHFKKIKTDNNFSAAKTACIYSHEDHILSGETLVLEITRGCRFQCKFCSFPLNGRKANTYFKDSDVLYNELVHNFEKFNVTKYILSDDTYNESVEKLIFFSDIFKKLPFQIEYSTYLRLDLIHRYPEMEKLLIESGLRGAFFGLESLNEKTARAIGKGISQNDAISTLKKLRSSWRDQVSTTGSFIVGLPHDSIQTVSNWLDVVKDPKFPLHDKTAFPLVINLGDENTPWQSEFEKNSPHYGYEVKASDSPLDAGVFWQNQYMNSREAKEIAIAFNRSFMDQKEHFDNFQHLMLMGYGLNHEEAMNLSPHDKIDAEKIDLLVAQRVMSYKSKFLQ